MFVFFRLVCEYVSACLVLLPLFMRRIKVTSIMAGFQSHNTLALEGQLQ